MKTFLKIFFASFVALVVFSLIVFLIGIWLLSSALQPSKPELGAKGVLVLDLTKDYPEQAKDNFFSSLSSDPSNDIPGLYDIIRMLHYAKTDSTIKGLYVKGGDNPNGFASCEELRKAIIDFKGSKKFVIAYGETMDQKSYYVSTAANAIYCHPNGGIEWDGFSVTELFMKGLLDKLGIQPQVFYAGKFKSATEPFRVTKMTEPNRIQTTDMLNDLYATFLGATAESRHLDTGMLHGLAQNGLIQTPADALKYKLVDGLKYDDGVKNEIAGKLRQPATDKINFITFGTYAKAVRFQHDDGDGKIAIIYAAGDIISGKNRKEEIASDDYIDLIRKARMDKDIKAIVFRVNSPGGSSLASDGIWREISLAKKQKPVVVSMSDYAASGGYYISCDADSIFADATTITGSIGVFSILPNMQPFFNNKLGITFDGVKTAPYADMGSAVRPLSEPEKRFMQASVDTIYNVFKQRVSEGRKASLTYIDSIAQGHVYTGARAIGLKLVDRTGTLQDAVDCAARMAKLPYYRTREYPEKKPFLQQLLSSSSFSAQSDEALVEKIGASQYQMLMQVKKLQDLSAEPQARLPFEFDIR